MNSHKSYTIVKKDPSINLRADSMPRQEIEVGKRVSLRQIKKSEHSQNPTTTPSIIQNNSQDIKEITSSFSNLNNQTYISNARTNNMHNSLEKFPKNPLRKTYGESTISKGSVEDVLKVQVSDTNSNTNINARSRGNSENYYRVPGKVISHYDRFKEEIPNFGKEYTSVDNYKEIYGGSFNPQNTKVKRESYNDKQYHQNIPGLVNRTTSDCNVFVKDSYKQNSKLENSCSPLPSQIYKNSTSIQEKWNLTSTQKKSPNVKVQQPVMFGNNTNLENQVKTHEIELINTLTKKVEQQNEEIETLQMSLFNSYLVIESEKIEKEKILEFYHGAMEQYGYKSKANELEKEVKRLNTTLDERLNTEKTNKIEITEPGIGNELLDDLSPIIIEKSNEQVLLEVFNSKLLNLVIEDQLSEKDKTIEAFISQNSKLREDNSKLSNFLVQLDTKLNNPAFFENQINNNSRLKTILRKKLQLEEGPNQAELNKDKNGQTYNEEIHGLMLKNLKQNNLEDVSTDNSDKFYKQSLSVLKNQNDELEKNYRIESQKVKDLEKIINSNQDVDYKSHIDNYRQLNQILLDRLNIVKKILEDKESQVLELESVLSTNQEKVGILEDSVSKIMAQTNEIQNNNYDTRMNNNFYNKNQEEIQNFVEKEKSLIRIIEQKDSAINALSYEKENLLTKLNHYYESFKTMEQRLDFMSQLEDKIEHLVKDNQKLKAHIENTNRETDQHRSKQEEKYAKQKKSIENDTKREMKYLKNKIEKIQQEQVSKDEVLKEVNNKLGETGGNLNQGINMEYLYVKKRLSELEANEKILIEDLSSKEKINKLIDVESKRLRQENQELLLALEMLQKDSMIMKEKQEFFVNQPNNK